MFKYLVILSSLFIISCAPKMYIHMNDQRVPNNYYKLHTTGDSGLNINILLRKYFIENDKQGRVLASQELSIIKENEIKDKNLVDIRLELIINNPTKRNYNIWEKFIIKEDDKIFPTEISRQRYKGNGISQQLTIYIPMVKKGVVTTTIKIGDETNYPIVILNNINIVFN